MFRRYALGFSNVGRQFSTMGSATPLEDAIRAKVCDLIFILLCFALLHPALVVMQLLLLCTLHCRHNSLTFISLSADGSAQPADAGDLQ